MDIVRSIRIGLARRGESQKWLAQQLKVSEQYISLIMTGRRGLSAKTVEKIAGAFDVPVSKFIEWGESD